MAKEEIAYWLVAFSSCRMTSLHNCPVDLFSELRARGLIDFDLDVTEKGRTFLKEMRCKPKTDIPEIAHGLEALASVTTSQQ